MGTSPRLTDLDLPALDLDRFRVDRLGRVDLDHHDPRDCGGVARPEAERATAHLLIELDRLQQMLFAQQRHKVLVVLQAIDTGGKDGTIRKVFSGLNPAGVMVWSFGVPSEEEREHDYLWRIHHRTPRSGRITVFNRSHYESVLVERVHELVPEQQWQRRYEHIRHWERMLADEGTTIIKFFLHISAEEQRRRLQARVDDPTRRWKFRAGDLAERARWPQYHEAFEDMLGRTCEPVPWWVVPADRKWFRNHLVARVVTETIAALDPRWPPAEPGVEGTVVT